MIKSALQVNDETHRSTALHNGKDNSSPHKRLASMCKIAADIINQLYNPIDAVNRFLNLALQNLEEDAQSRQFLIESKQGIRKTSDMLRQLHNCTEEMEKEIGRMSANGQEAHIAG